MSDEAYRAAPPPTREEFVSLRERVSAVENRKPTPPGMARQVRWLGATFGIPSVGLMAIGYEWSAMSGALAVCSCVALTIVTVGVFTVMTVACEWKW